MYIFWDLIEEGLAEPGQLLGDKVWSNSYVLAVAADMCGLPPGELARLLAESFCPADDRGMHLCPFCHYGKERHQHTFLVSESRNTGVCGACRVAANLYDVAMKSGRRDLVPPGYDWNKHRECEDEGPSLMATTAHKVVASAIKNTTAVVPSPWQGMNEAMGGGTAEGQTTTFVGQPAVGKTALLCNFAVAAASQGAAVLLVCPDQGKFATLARMGGILGLDTAKLLAREPQETMRLEELLRRTAPYFHIEDEIADVAERVAQFAEMYSNQKRLVLVDQYPDLSASQDHLALAAMFTRLRNAAARHGVALAGSCWASRAAYSGRRRGAQLSSASGSSVFEYKSDTLATLRKKRQEDPEHTIIEVRFEKLRWGVAGTTVLLRLHGPSGRMTEVAARDQQVPQKPQDHKDTEDAVREAVRSALPGGLLDRELCAAVPGRDARVREARDALAERGELVRATARRTDKAGRQRVVSVWVLGERAVPVPEE